MDIPEDVIGKIDLLVNDHYPTLDRVKFRRTLETGYQLSQSKIDELQRQLEESLLLYNNQTATVLKLQKEVEFLNKNCDNLNEVISDCGKEIGRLKGLIEKVFKEDRREGSIWKDSVIEIKWQKFKEENNL